MTRPFWCFALAVALPVAGSDAVAATCSEQAAAFARDYDLQWPKPPATVESRGTIAMDEVAPMEEPVEPPAGDTAMSTEPSDEPSPEIAPSPSKGRATGLTAEQRTRMETLLLEAIKAAEEGDSDRCFERLNEAKTIP